MPKGLTVFRGCDKIEAAFFFDEEDSLIVEAPLNGFEAEAEAKEPYG